MGFPGSTALANLVLAPIGRHMTARELRIHWVSPAGPIVADFRAGTWVAPGAYYGWCEIIGLRSLSAAGAAKLVWPSFRQMVVHGL